MNEFKAIDIEHPEVWNANFFFDSDNLTGLLVNKTDPAQAYEFHCALAGKNYTSIVEDFFYNNSVLLSEFSRVDVVVESSQWVLLPSDFTQEDTEIMESAFVENGEDAVFICDSISTPNALIKNLWRWENVNIYNFLNRSLNSPRFHHQISPLVSFFSKIALRGNDAKIFVNFNSKRNLDLVCFGLNRELIFANSFRFNGADDCIYFILSAAKSIGFKFADIDVYFAGYNDCRSEVIEQLRKFSSRVGPAMLPPHISELSSDFKQLPLSLILSSLCE